MGHLNIASCFLLLGGVFPFSKCIAAASNAAITTFATSASSHTSFGDAGVVLLGAKNFGQLVTEGFWLVEFYAPWCGHCKRLNPILDEIAPAAKAKGMNIGKIDATVNKKIADRFS